MATQNFTQQHRVELEKQVYFMSINIDALEGLAQSLPDAIENELIDGEQIGHLLKCVSYSLLNVQRDVVRTLEDSH